MLGSFWFNTTKSIRFEPGAAARLGELAGPLVGERILLLTDRGLVGMGLPQRLRDVGIGRDNLGRCAAEAMKQTRLLVNNPREVTEADARAIYEAAW
jgi:alcohol dehydrogenase class IV